MGWRKTAFPILIGAALLFSHAAASPADADADVKRGYSELEAGDLDRAVADFDQAVQLDPNLALAYFYRGLARFAQGAGEPALADLQKAQQVKPDWTAIGAVMGEIEDVLRKDAATPSFEAPTGDATSKAVGRTHECTGYFTIFSVLMVKSGDVLVHYDVTPTGAITGVGVGTSSGDVWMDRAAVLCVGRHWRNTPAYQNGVAVASPGHTALLRYVMQ